MQSTPTLKDTDPHDVFAIETLLHAHAEKAPPLAHDPAAPPRRRKCTSRRRFRSGAPIPQVEPTFRATDMRDIQVENVRPTRSRWMTSSLSANGLARQMDEARGHGAARPVRRHRRRRLAALWRSRPRRWPRDGRRHSCWRASCPRKRLPPPSNRARLPLKPPQQIRPPRSRAAGRTGSARASRRGHCCGRSFGGIEPVAVDGAGSRQHGPTGRGTESQHRAAQGRPGPDGA